MIRVTIELFPHGQQSLRETLGVMDIWNDATGDPTTGNYGFCAWKAGTPKDILHTRDTITRAKWNGEVKDFPRKKLLVYDLLYRCLKVAFGERNE